MKKQRLLIAAVIAGSFSLTQAQEVYVVSGQENINYISFKEVKALDYQGKVTDANFFSRAMLNSLPGLTKQASSDCLCSPSSSHYIAAMALDHQGHLLSMDMLGSTVYRYTSDGLMAINNPNTLPSKWTEEALFARMATAADRSTYALNNNGSELLRITNGQITSLGMVKGYKEIFEQREERAGFGGDMIADEEGNIYVLTAFAYVVKIDVDNMTATYVGQITGLPEGYSVNGAAVLKNNDILISSSQPKDFYVLNMSSLQAAFYANNNMPTYDLASKYLLQKAKINVNNNLTSITLNIIPTIVKDNFFNIVSDGMVEGKALVSIYNIDGKLIQKQNKNIVAGDNTIRISNFTPGYYIVTITNDQNQELYTTKISVK